jgi:hypothetical protein
MCCYSSDPPVPELFYGAPYSLYRFRIDTRDDRFEAFDFTDSPMVLGVSFRTHTLGVIARSSFRCKNQDIRTTCENPRQ